MRLRSEPHPGRAPARPRQAAGGRCPRSHGSGRSDVWLGGGGAIGAGRRGEPAPSTPSSAAATGTSSRREMATEPSTPGSGETPVPFRFKERDVEHKGKQEDGEQLNRQTVSRGSRTEPAGSGAAARPTRICRPCPCDVQEKHVDAGLYVPGQACRSWAPLKGQKQRICLQDWWSDTHLAPARTRKVRWHGEPRGRKMAEGAQRIATHSKY